jgi:hypothetical protein
VSGLLSLFKHSQWRNQAAQQFELTKQPLLATQNTELWFSFFFLRSPVLEPVFLPGGPGILNTNTRMMQTNACNDLRQCTTSKQAKITSKSKQAKMNLKDIAARKARNA